MASVVYTPEYWQRAQSLVDRSEHRCEYCKLPHSDRNKPGYRFVRVIDIGAEPGDLRNLVLACTTCRPKPVGPKITRKQILDKIAELPFPAQPAAASAHGR